MAGKGIPTEYKGYCFRSRLEATWAAFFDGLGWKWQYEPIGCNGYIPDFILQFPFAPLAVEVKPALEFGQLWNHTERIERSGLEYDAVIVGAGQMREEWNDPSPILGLLSQKDFYGAEGEFDIGWCWGTGRIFTCVGCGETSIYHQDRSWNCCVCGHYDPRAYSHMFHRGGHYLKNLWAESHQKTQWRGARRVGA